MADEYIDEDEDIWIRERIPLEIIPITTLKPASPEPDCPTPKKIGMNCPSLEILMPGVRKPGRSRSPTPETCSPEALSNSRTSSPEPEPEPEAGHEQSYRTSSMTKPQPGPQPTPASPAEHEISSPTKHDTPMSLEHILCDVPADCTVADSDTTSASRKSGPSQTAQKVLDTIAEEATSCRPESRAQPLPTPPCSLNNSSLSPPEQVLYSPQVAQQRIHQAPRPIPEEPYRLPEARKTRLPAKAEGQFPCPIEGCGERFRTKYLLKSHKDVHSNHRPYHCPHASCARQFKRKNELKRHISTHSGLGFRCPICTENENEREYPRPDNLVRHAKNYHPGRDEEIRRAIQRRQDEIGRERERKR